MNKNLCALFESTIKSENKSLITYIFFYYTCIIIQRYNKDTIIIISCSSYLFDKCIIIKMIIFNQICTTFPSVSKPEFPSVSILILLLFVILLCTTVVVVAGHDDTCIVCVGGGDRGTLCVSI